MKRIILPMTDLSCSRLGFGTASLHHILRARDRQALLAAALDAGFTHFDTARMYGEGIAERELGRFLPSERQRVTIGTKFGLPAIALFERVPPLLYAHRAFGRIGRRLFSRIWDRRPRLLSIAAAESSLSRSLKALRTDWIDILFLHEPLISDIDSILPMADWLQKQKTSGRVRYLGLAGQAKSCVEIARQTDGLFDVLQVEDSLAAREADTVTDSGRSLQITYGYLRQAGSQHLSSSGVEVVRAALERNRDGVVLVSSRRLERLCALAACVD